MNGCVARSTQTRAQWRVAPWLHARGAMVAKKKTSTKKSSTTTSKRTIKTPKTGAPRMSKSTPRKATKKSTKRTAKK